eukprot:TRINITY_DN4595_c0_g1_i2.p1 TRINITY_DN4595_c0_g1~~TRINITY_DN4595_c0_g1_i2.p1  ORF type:complete len:510 (+),score=134.60 TRINITY_DN4595_c0_g1_i2:50-1579(+)
MDLDAAGSGKALVIGGSGRLGVEVGKMMLSEKVVTKVVLMGRSEGKVKAAAKAVGNGAVGVVGGDVLTDERTFIRRLAEVYDEEGGFDFIVIAIGGDHVKTALPTAGQDLHDVVTQFESRSQLHFQAPSRCLLTLAPLIKSRHPSRRVTIVTIGTQLIRYGVGIPTKAAFISSKASLASLGTSITAEYESITVSQVNPSSKISHTDLAEAIGVVCRSSQRCHISSIDLLPVKDVREGAYRPNPGLKGHVAFVTGGSNGIGKAIALGLAKQGCDVAIVGRNKEAIQQVVETCRGYGVRAEGYSVDVSDNEGVRRAVDDAVARFGRITTLVASAGYNKRRNALDKNKDGGYRTADPKVWGDLVDVNLKASMTVTQYVLPQLAQAAKDPTLRGGPTLIYISSNMVRVPWAAAGGQASYHVTKSAISTFSSTLYRDLEKFGIKSVSFHPALVDTSLGTTPNKTKDSRPINPKFVIQLSDMELAAVYSVGSKVCAPSIDFSNIGMPDVNPNAKL